jgi:glycerol-1-phosphate dehydrogenase [NAD(P)+]
MRSTQVDIPSFVRIKPGALRRLGEYAARHRRSTPVLLRSAGLPSHIVTSVHDGFAAKQVDFAFDREVEGPSFDVAGELLAELPGRCDSIFGLGGGRALDLAKYVASLAGVPYYSVPTSLSNDGFCAPQSSLLLKGERKSLPCRMPFAVVVDTAVCREAPEILWLSGVGDLIAKLTAVQDWKLAYHNRGETVDDFAAVLSTSTVYQFIGWPHRDDEGLRILATALMMNGVAMAVCGSSRPASGAEHLISHALDRLSKRPRYHGLQVGVATYAVARLQGDVHTQTISKLFSDTGFWECVHADPIPRRDWLEAVHVASKSRPERYTILNHRDCIEDVEAMIDSDPLLAACFV